VDNHARVRRSSAEQRPIDQTGHSRIYTSLTHERTMPIHLLYRNGRLYDSLDYDTHATTQIARMAAMLDFPDDTIELRDEKGEVIYQRTPPVTVTREQLPATQINDTPGAVVQFTVREVEALKEMRRELLSLRKSYASAIKHLVACSRVPRDNRLAGMTPREWRTFVRKITPTAD